MVVFEGKVGCSCPEVDGASVTWRSYRDMTPAGGSHMTYFTDITKSGDKFFGKGKGTWKVETKKDGSWETVGPASLNGMAELGNSKDLRGKEPTKVRGHPRVIRRHGKRMFVFRIDAPI